MADEYKLILMFPPISLADGDTRTLCDRDHVTRWRSLCWIRVDAD